MQILGVSIDNQKAFTCIIKLVKQEKKVLKVETFSLEDPHKVAHLLKLLLKYPTAFVIPSKNIFMHEHVLPKAKQKLIDSMIDFQIETVTFINPKDCITATRCCEITNTQTIVHSFTVKKNELSRHLHILKSKNFDPEIISPQSQALTAYVTQCNPSCTDAFILNLEDQTLTFCTLHKGKCQQYFCPEVHLLDLYQALAHDKNKTSGSLEVLSLAKQIDLTELNKKTYPHLFAKLQTFTNQISTIFFAMEQKFGKKPLIILGKTQAFLGLEKYIQEKCKSFIDTSLTLYNPIDWQEFASCLGGAFDFRSAIDFRKKEFFSVKKRNAQAKKNLFFFFSTTIVCFLSLFFFHLILSEKSSTLASNYEQIITRKNPEIAKMIFIEKDLSLISLHWEKVLEIFSKKNPYILTVPNVSQTLSFLFTHPLVTHLEDNPIYFTNISYELEKMPVIGAMKTPYKAKVELDITAKNLQTAKAFMQSLQEQNFIDTSRDPLFEEKELGYKITFFLN